MRFVFVPLLCGLIACGGSPSAPPGPVTISLTASGASPAAITIASGGSVHFVNNDTASHQIASSACTELASPPIAAGKDFTATIAGPKTCDFHDALNPGATAFSGTVTVSPPGSSDAGY